MFSSFCCLDSALPKLALPYGCSIFGEVHQAKIKITLFSVLQEYQDYLIFLHILPIFCLHYL
jgi:hypothetical protein